MDKITLILSNIKFDLFRLIEPYKHTSISTMDADIENQLEKVSKKVVVASGNVFINTLIYAIDGAKFLHYFLIDEFDKYMNIQNSDELQYVHIIEDNDSENNDISNEEEKKNEKDEEDDEQLYKAHDEALDKIIDNEEKKHEPTTSWFGFGASKDKSKQE